MSYLIKEVSDISGISIRMLRHYDSNGLLKPRKNPDNGYRYYSESDLEKLYRIMYLKELDFSISDIMKILDKSEGSMTEALAGQRELLIEKRDRLNKIIRQINILIKGEKRMNNKEKFTAFDEKAFDEHKNKYAEEAKRKYNGTPEYEQSKRRTSEYSKSDWEKINSEAAEIYRKFADLMGSSPENPEALAVAKEWQNHISHYYYECSDEVFIGLADMYIADSRFTNNIDKYGNGLAHFMSRAMKASCIKI